MTDDVGRERALDLATAWLEHAEVTLNRARLLQVRLGAGHFTCVLSMLHASVRARMADGIQGSTASVEWTERLRWAAWKARSWVRRERQHNPSGCGGILLAPRREGHLRQMAGAAALLRHRGVPVWWLLFRKDLAQRLNEQGERVLWAGALGNASDVDWALGAADWVRAASWLQAEPPPDADRSAWRRARYGLLSAVAGEGPDVFRLAAIYRRLLVALAPDLLVVGNPYTCEGAVGCAAAEVRGIPTATLQHGRIAHGQQEWRRARVDHVTVWGEDGAAALRAAGLRERLRLTGNPELDHVRWSRSPPSIDVLVALSGAGHMVSHADHWTAVDRIVTAARALPDRRWRIRLHPKDPEAPYRKKLDGVPNLELDARRPTPLLDELGRVRTLLTVSSGAAVEAMLRDVPVVTLDVPGSQTPEYVPAGATHHVAGSGLDLAHVIRRLLDEGPAPAVADSAARYVRMYYGPLDGRSAERLADAWLEWTRSGIH